MSIMLVKCVFGFLALSVLSAVSRADSLTVEAASSLLEALNAEQQKQIQFNLDDQERQNWGYTPKVREGVPLRALNPSQRERLFNLLSVCLSKTGYLKAQSILLLEGILGELEGKPGVRDPRAYYVSFFGKPAVGEFWAWRFEGHHLSLNFTVTSRQDLYLTPHFWGANPARVDGGRHEGLRVLKDEEDRARTLLLALNKKQRKRATIAAEAYPEILTGARKTLTPLPAHGLALSEMTEPQRALFWDLVDVYLQNLPATAADARRARIRMEAPESLYFAWAGPGIAGERHYYRVQGASFLIEYDNYQGQGNHVHAVWREFDGDFGRDVLADHLREMHLNKAQNPEARQP